MGLSFHYSASIISTRHIEMMVDEVKDISKSLSWESICIQDENLYGIVVSPDVSEPLWLTFANNKKLCTPVSILYNKEDSENYYTASTKTFGGSEIHKSLLRLLKYLSTKYFS